MILFDNFHETIFLKSSSNLEKDINELKEIRKTLSNTYQIDKDIKLLETGLQGEKEIEFELKNANIGMYVLHDINIEFEDLKAQIDYVIVTKAYTYLVECKNMIGNITINENGEFKREYNYNGEKIIEGIYSPYRQALRHKEVLKKIWLSNHNKISAYLWEKSFDRNYKPLVVLTNSKGLTNMRYAPKEIKDITIRSDALIEYIKKDIVHLNANSLIGENGVVIVEINNMDAVGQVKIKGQVWSAKSLNGEIIKENKEVKVEKIEGVHLIVKNID